MIRKRRVGDFKSICHFHLWSCNRSSDSSVSLSQAPPVEAALKTLLKSRQSSFTLHLSANNTHFIGRRYLMHCAPKCLAKFSQAMQSQSHQGCKRPPRLSSSTIETPTFLRLIMRQCTTQSLGECSSLLSLTSFWNWKQDFFQPSMNPSRLGFLPASMKYIITAKSNPKPSFRVLGVDLGNFLVTGIDQTCRN